MRDFIVQAAAAGVGVYPSGRDQPDTPTTGDPSPIRLTEDQATSAAAGAWAHAGLTGAELDSLVTTKPLASGAAPLPASLLVESWAEGVHTPAAAAARKYLGEQNWSEYRSVVFPEAVLVLFAADLTRPPADASSPATATNAAFLRDAVSGGSVCEQFKGFVDGTIEKVFTALGHIQTTGYDGQIVHDIFAFLGNVVATGVNYGLDTVKFVVINGVNVATGPITRAIATVAGVLGAASQFLLAVQPWTGVLTPDPRISHRDMAAHPGRINLRVSTGVGPDQWPPLIQGCAAAAGVTLPPLTPHGGKLTWTVKNQFPAPMIEAKTGDLTLASDGSAAWNFTTLPEPPDVAERGQERDNGSVRVDVTLHRDDLNEVYQALAKMLVAQLPDVLAESGFGGTLAAQMSAQLKKLGDKLTSLGDVHVFTFLGVHYHELDEQPSPVVGPDAPTTPTPTPTPRKSVLPASCPATLGAGFSLAHQQNLPVAGFGCEYNDGSTARVLDVRPGVPYRDGDIPGAKSVSVAGADAAWLLAEPGKYPALYLNVPGGSLVIGTDDTQTDYAIAKQLLGSS